MIHGNIFAQQILRNIILSIDPVGQKQSIFLLLTGPKNIGKTTVVQELAKETLGPFFVQDFLFAQDMTDVLGKKHPIKVGSQTDTSTIDLPDGTVYYDKTMRQLTYRLQQSAASGKKILFLENIDRMTIGAANAFLKAAEEPLPGRIVIATTTHVSNIMDTIVSRAIVVPFQVLTEQEMDAFVHQSDIQLPKGDLAILYKRMAMGRPGVLARLAELDYDMQRVFLSALESLQSKESVHTQQDALVKIHKAGYLHAFLDAWIAQLAAFDSDQAQHRIVIKKKLQTNVSIDRLLLSGILK